MTAEDDLRQRLHALGEHARTAPHRPLGDHPHTAGSSSQRRVGVAVAIGLAAVLVVVGATRSDRTTEIATDPADPGQRALLGSTQGLPEHDLVVFLHGDEDMTSITDWVDRRPGITITHVQTQQQSFANFLDWYVDDPELTAGLTPEAMPAVVGLDIEGSAASQSLLATINGIPGVYHVAQASGY